MRLPTADRTSALLISVGLTACGGQVVFNEGAGGAGGTSPSGSTTSSTSAGDCVSDGNAFTEALEAAQECSVASQLPQCDGSVVIKGPCGCPTMLNETQPDKVSAAQAARAKWAKLGICGEICGGACAPATAGVPGFCQPQPNGTGLCMPH